MENVKNRTDQTSGVGKNPSLTQATDDYNQLKTAFDALKAAESTRDQKISAKNTKDQQYTTAKTTYNNAKYSNIQQYLTNAQTTATNTLNKVLNNTASTTDQINNAYDAYNRTLDEAINKASAAKAFKDKYDQVSNPIKDNKYSTIKNALDTLNEIDRAKTGLDNINATDASVFNSGKTKLDNENSNVNSSKSKLDALETEIGKLKTLSTPTNDANNTDITYFHGLVNTDTYANQLKNEVTNALSPNSYNAPTTTATTLVATNNAAISAVNSYNNALSTAQNQFNSEANQRVKQKAKELIRAEYEKITSALRTNIDTFKAMNGKTPNDIGQKIKQEYESAKSKLDTLNTGADKYLQQAKMQDQIFNDAQNAINLLNSGQEKTRLQGILNGNNVSDTELKKALKDAKIEKVKEKTATISTNNPKKKEIQNKLNQLKNNNDVELNQNQLDKISQEIEDHYEVFGFYPTESTTIPNNTTYQWTNKDVVGILKLNKSGGKYANKWIYIVANNGNNRVVSHPIQYTNDQLKFTFAKHKFKVDGDYNLEKVVFGDRSGIQDSQILRNNTVIDKDYANTSNFNVKNNGEVIASNVTLHYENKYPVTRVGSQLNFTSGSNLIEAVTDNRIRITGFRTDNIEILQNPAISVQLKGKATFQTLSQQPGINKSPKHLVHDVTVEGGISGVNVIQEQNGDISFQFEALELKAGYVYNLESITFRGRSNLNNQTKVYTWHRQNQQDSDNIKYENNTYTKNTVETEHYLFKGDHNHRNNILSPNLQQSVKGYSDDVHRIVFNNDWDAFTFSKLFNYLNSKVPSTQAIYEPEGESARLNNKKAKLSLRDKWVNYIAEKVGRLLIEHRKVTNSSQTRIPTDTHYGLHRALHGVQLGYRHGSSQNWNELFIGTPDINSKNNLWPVLGGKNLETLTRLERREDLIGELQLFMKRNANDWRLWYHSPRQTAGFYDWDAYTQNAYYTLEAALYFILHLGKAEFREQP
ncbi:hypothetical protein EG856_01110 [Mycoplasmopsis phocirhinis]|uniref:Uncharacterized protein n=1 Tax=Mycoplasmopsis phocirhinis TaxID=142650 RepID=A0A4P6MLN2_9BACT|nr:hypothetical protein [Mycoplasmopsis phocirhinis]QBF34525.1 hypothetical protein EG856_01110 [Mycoplasmopsis phocirhinis]